MNVVTNKPICNVTLKDKRDVIQTIALHKVILSELNQFGEGLSVLGVSHSMKKHPLLLSSFFCYDEDLQLTPGTHVTFSVIITCCIM